MADILIRGMAKMPGNCLECMFAGFGGMRNELNVCMFSGESQSLISHERMSKCPLVPIPEGHGRLGDLDAMMNNIGDVPYKGAVRRVLMSAPTIIEADLEWKMKNCCCFSNTDQAEGGGEDGDE